MNTSVLSYLGIKLEKRNEYAIDYITELLETYKTTSGLESSTFIFGVGHQKSMGQHHYQEMPAYRERLKSYTKHIEVCGGERYSYSKTDHDATFMRIKRDYMGNDHFYRHTTSRLPYVMST